MLEQIDKIKKDAESYHDAVNAFDSVTEDKRRYVFLEETLTRLILKLDDLITGNNEKSRSAKIDALLYIKNLLQLLKENAKKTDNTNQEDPEVKEKLETIEKLKRDADSYSKDVHTFDGYADDGRYLFLEEMLTRVILKLDNVEAGSNESIRLRKIEVQTYTNKLIESLEVKAETNRKQNKIGMIEFDESYAVAPSDEAIPQVTPGISDSNVTGKKSTYQNNIGDNSISNSANTSVQYVNESDNADAKSQSPSNRSLHTHSHGTSEFDDNYAVIPSDKTISHIPSRSESINEIPPGYGNNSNKPSGSAEVRILIDTERPLPNENHPLLLRNDQSKFTFNVIILLFIASIIVVVIIFLILYFGFFIHH